MESLDDDEARDDGVGRGDDGDGITRHLCACVNNGRMTGRGRGHL